MSFSESCELLLAAACLAAALTAMQDRHLWRVLGFLLVAATALVGSRLTGGEEALRSVHQVLSTVSGRIALLLIAIGSVKGTVRHLVLISIAALMLWLPQPLALTGNLIALAIIALPGRSRCWSLAATGSLLVSIAGLVVGTQGNWAGVPREDFYHLILMLCALCWMLAQLRGTRWARRPSPLLDS